MNGGDGVDRDGERDEESSEVRKSEHVDGTLSAQTDAWALFL
jgi:hypothetical protein